MRNKYAPNLDSNDFVIRYEGVADRFYCFRIVLSGHKGIEAQAFGAEISTWAIEKTKHEKLVGNRFGASKDHPTVPYANPSGKDLFLLLSHLDDVRKFENRYAVLGVTPTMLI